MKRLQAINQLVDLKSPLAHKTIEVGRSFDFKRSNRDPSSMLGSFDIKKTSSLSKHKIGLIVPSNENIIMYKNLSKQTATRGDIDYDQQ